MNLSELLSENLAKCGEYPLLRFQDKVITNRELTQSINRVASGLSELGIQPGDRVALVMGNSPELLICMFACFKLGAWAMPLVLSLRPPEVQLVLADARPSAVIAHKNFAECLHEPIKNTESVRFRIGVGKGPAKESWRSWEDWTVGQSAEFTARDCEPDEVALLLYTSGTTGDPKGVMLSHLNLYSNAVNSAHSQGFHPGEVHLLVLPLNHSFGVTAWLAGLVYGMEVVLLPRFDAGEVFRLIEKHRVESTAMVPTMLAFLVEAPERGKSDVASLKRIVVGAAPLRLALRDRFERALPGAQILEAYGLTEASPGVTVTRPDRPVRPRSVGQSIENQELCVMDRKGRVLGPGEVGEVCTRGSHVMIGYYKKEEETRSVIRDGWLHTGDAGYLDEDGYLYLTARIKELIIRGGQNVYPIDIERVLLKHSAVAEAAVIGIPDEVYGEEIAAMVVKKTGMTVTEGELIEFCRENLAPFQVPKVIHFHHLLPKSHMGKIRKKDLKEHFEGAVSGEKK